MKKLTFVGLLCFAIGCDESPVDENGRHIGEPDGDRIKVVIVKGADPLMFRYVLVDGHEYLVMTGTSRTGVTHSPKCKCLSPVKNETIRQSTQGDKRAMNKQLTIHCTKGGIRVSGADNVGSTSDALVSSKRNFMRVCEHWWNTYCESGGNFERDVSACNAPYEEGSEK